MFIRAYSTRELVSATPGAIAERGASCIPRLVMFDSVGGTLSFVTRSAGSSNEWTQDVYLGDWWETIGAEILWERGEVSVSVPINVSDEAETEQGTPEYFFKDVDIDVQMIPGEEITSPETEELRDPELEMTWKDTGQTRIISWAELIAEIPEVTQMDITVHCNCPAYLYWGSQYNLTQLDTAIVPEHRSPVIRDPSNENMVCKHLYAVLTTFF
jgi:hypothetical protein